MPLIFPRLIWSSLAVALAVGTVPTGVQRLQAAPLIAAAEAYEGQRDQKVETPALVAALVAPLRAVAAHTHDDKHDHNNDMAKQWEPANCAERTGWTWVANALHAFSMALLVLAVMGVWRFQRGVTLTALPLAGFVVAAGWLSFHLWPTMGLPATVPGMEVAPLQARQLWSVLAVGSAATACALAAFGTAKWRRSAVAVLLALPFVVGSPHFQGDALAGYSPQAHAAVKQLAQQFFWATTWVALSFWLSIGLACGLVFQRWLQPVLTEIFETDRLGTAQRTQPA